MLLAVVLADTGSSQTGAYLDGGQPPSPLLVRRRLSRNPLDFRRCDLYLFARLFKLLIKSGLLTVIDARGRRSTFGKPSREVRPVTIRFTDSTTPRRIAFDPARGAGEAYMDGRLVIEDGSIRDLIDLIGYNTRWDADNPTRIKLWRTQLVASKLDTWNWARRSKRNVAHR